MSIEKMIRIMLTSAVKFLYLLNLILRLSGMSLSAMLFT
ncbi:putative membrane protein [Wolbachia endosymbiont of Drosophila ananassae]|nr:putative membrane protein [Wolbachia endosymbiont of Drosophila ananassae]